MAIISIKNNCTQPFIHESANVFGFHRMFMGWQFQPNDCFQPEHIGLSDGSVAFFSHLYLFLWPLNLQPLRRKKTVPRTGRTTELGFPSPLIKNAKSILCNCKNKKQAGIMLQEGTVNRQWMCKLEKLGLSFRIFTHLLQGLWLCDLTV